MDDAKKLLDSLMGSHRNLDRKVAKAKKGQNFKEDNICKHYLIGFCPQHEELFHSTKRDIGDCKKIHSDAMKEEFEQHADRERLQGEYERKLKQYLEDLVRGADEWVTRERRNIQDSNRLLEENGPSEAVRAEIKKTNDKAAALLAEAENCAEAGNIQESKSKADMAAELRKRAQDWEEKPKAADEPGTKNVCEICGSRMESGDMKYARFFHQEGKIHLGYVKIREWLADMRKRVRNREEQDEARRAERGSRRRDRSRSRDGGIRKDRAERESPRGHDECEPPRAERETPRGKAPRDDREPPRGDREPSRGEPSRDDRDPPQRVEPELPPDGGYDEPDSRAARRGAERSPLHQQEEGSRHRERQRDEHGHDDMDHGSKGASQSRKGERSRAQDPLATHRDDRDRHRGDDRYTDREYRDCDREPRGPPRRVRDFNGDRDQYRDRDRQRDRGHRESRGSQRSRCGDREDYPSRW